MDNLAVPHKVMEALRKAKLHTFESILEYSHGDLMRRTGLKASQVQGLIEIVSEAVVADNSLVSALHLYQRDSIVLNWGRLSMGCPILDQYLQGGILPQAVTEVAGTSAAGKTQLCLQLSLIVQLPLEYGGLKGRAVHISTEGALPSGRLQQLCEAVVHRYTELGLSKQLLMDNVLIQHCATVQTLMGLLQHGLQILLEQNHDVKLIIIDSIAALFRAEYTASEVVTRAQDLKSIASLLHQLINKYHVTIICTNQMTADLTHNRVKPALGLVWSNALNTRFILQREETVDNEESFQQGIKLTPRTLSVELSSHLPMIEVKYYIDDEGVHGLDMIDTDVLDLSD